LKKEREAKKGRVEKESTFFCLSKVTDVKGPTLRIGKRERGTVEKRRMRGVGRLFLEA